MRAGGEAVGRADPGQSRTGQIDQFERAERLDQRECPLGQLALAHDVDAGVATERLDERPVGGFGRVEHTVAPERVVEPIAAAAPEEQRIVSGAVDPQPTPLKPDQREVALRQVGRWEWEVLGDGGRTYAAPCSP